MLLGRTRELDAIDGFLSDVRAGRGRGLLVTGEAGIGKTALLDAAQERAGDQFRVITTVGIEAEADLPFASLVEIANPLLGHLDDLPAPQAGAIRAALVLAEHPAPVRSRLAACAGLLGLLRSAAREEPLLVLIDDAQWLDASSRECVGYAARRLDGARVGMLAAARTGPGTTTLDGRFADELPLHGLGPDHAKQLLRTTAGELAPTAVESMLDAAAGNPLALIELPALLSDQQRRGLAPFAPAPVPGGDLWEAFAHRVAALGPQARQAVLVASASYDRALAPVVGACRELGVAVSALEHAEEAGVLTLHDDQVNFTHPLLRGVAYGQGTEAERRRAHAALARHAEPDAGAWHQAAAALGPSPEVSAALEAAGRRATTRGAHTSAADAFERAAQLSDDADARAVRLLSAGLAAALGGDYERATVLLESIATVEQPRLRASVSHLLALVTLSGGIRDALSNHASLTEEAERIARLDGAAAELHADAAVIATVAGDCALALESAERAMAVLPADAAAPVRRHALAMLGMGLALRGRTAEGRAALDRAARLLPEVDPLSPAAQSIAFGMHAQICVGRARLLRDEVLALESATREAGGYGLMPYYLLLAADAGYRIGDWPAAERDIDEAVATAEHSSQRGPLSLALVVRARLHAVRGRTDAARADIEAGVAAAEPAGYGSTVLWAQAASGFLALGLGDAEEAIQELETVKQLAELASMEDPLIVPWAPDLVEAYCRAGRQEDARRIAALLDTQAQRSGVALARALAARCDGLVAEEEIDAPFQGACELHADADAPFEAARTLLAWGRRLHRARRIEARERLREAHAAFERLGAEPWVQGALAELHAAGGRRTRAGERDELTAQELRVALAVARGATNREVAAELFLSPKTIEFHLRLIYRKLGVRSRTQLARLVADGGLEEVAEDPAARV